MNQTTLPNPALPLVVDLDGTLSRVDTLHESLVKCFQTAPLGTMGLVFGARGKADLKDRLAHLARPDATLLPYRREVLDLVEEHRKAGGVTVLATGAHRAIAEEVAAHLGCFDQVYATEPGRNLIGQEKADFLVSRFGRSCFDYVGDSTTDIPVWRAARRGWVAGGKAKSIAAGSGLELTPLESLSKGRAWKTLRPHQWMKNALLFLPILSSHQLFQVRLVESTLFAFLAFSTLASLVYVGNDLFDRESDRKNPSKAKRPIASGWLSLPGALLLMLALLVATGAFASRIPWQAGVALVVYFVANIVYTVHIKRRLLADVFLLAFMYVWRIVAGSLATGIELSGWLLGFSVFLFLSLGFAKRYAEVIRMGAASGNAAGRAWRPDDAPVLAGAGISTGVAGAIVLSLYVTGNSFSKLYASPELVTALSPLFLYWILRIWIQTCRKEMHEDPVLFAAKDKVSYLVLICAALILAIASIRI
ncbi:MAG TPA: UbiA family prenyltransferase [Fibrobacteria bacterium]|nr:UbiA family prenyltransferase [Fibrobacteria bacterium]